MPSAAVLASSMDFFDDPAIDWSIRDAAIDLTLAKEPVPEMWERQIPAGEERTVADLGDDWKRANSHRARAAAALLASLS